VANDSAPLEMSCHRPGGATIPVVPPNLPPAQLVVLFGPPAVGKTAVGRELAKLTGVKLYHGHMTMDVISEFFPFGSPSFMRLHRLVQLQFLEEAAEQRMSMIVTTGWHFAAPIDTAATIALSEPFVTRGGEAHYVELWAPIEVRLQRNDTEERRGSKKTGWSTAEFLRHQDSTQDRNSHGRLPVDLPFLRLETADMSAADAAAAVAGYMSRSAAPAEARD
jgi:shikimate kinase